MKATLALSVAGLLIVQPTAAPASGGVEPDSRVAERLIEGRSLEDDLLGETADRKVLVYLPPRYREKGHKRYPVVYLLSGLGGDHRNFASDGSPNRLGLMRVPQVDVGLDLKATADELIASGEIPEAILVGVSGMNTYANPWFACSDTIGDYRSFGLPVTTPVDAPIPDTTFAALWGSTPGGGNFVTNAVYSAAAAFSSNPKNLPLLFDFPFVYPEKVVAPKVLARWADADLVSQINRATGNLARTPVYLARGIDPTILHPEVGDIPLLRDALLANGIAHTFDELPGDDFNKNAGRGT